MRTSLPDHVGGTYDVLVIGAGHAGCEAALAAARLGCRTLLVTLNLDSVANMPCNPNIGGTAKGQLVREIDALGGQMGITADGTMIQMRILNRAKGPAVYSQRAQIDRRAYQTAMKQVLEGQPDLEVHQAEVTALLFHEPESPGAATARRVLRGVRVRTGTVYEAKTVILTTGTFLRGKIIIGDMSYSGGPDGMHAADLLSESLLEAGIRLMRFKTGTPARVHRRSIDFSRMEIQPGDDEIVPFSFLHEPFELDQIPCWLTKSTARTHAIIRENLHRSPLYGGMIEGVGPRYCPSFEDKVVRFAERESHQIFVEPMGRETEEMYLQGFSSSLPEDVQAAMMRSVPGLEQVQVMRSAYAIEYDCVDPLQLYATLEFRDIPGLYSAGQSNGSSGYEEAAGQGLVAGINAARKVRGLPPVEIDRSQAYIGVLIDDLVTKGTPEPYRMMTSRAEYRLYLRQDNADLRLTELGWQIGLVDPHRYARFQKKKAAIEEELNRVRAKILPPTQALNAFLQEHGSAPVQTGVRLSDLLRRPELDYPLLAGVDPERPTLPKEVWEQVSITIRYEGYLERQMQQIGQFRRQEARRLPQDVDWREVSGLSLEARQKLWQHKPESLGQASRISGVSPSDIAVLQIWLEARQRREVQSQAGGLKQTLEGKGEQA
jgi:tRNA uridine 5-carboxymethylaminomethyl modification enzyme